LQMTTLSQAVASMTSLQIADLVESRHDKVKQSIERLANRGVIVQPPMGDEREADTLGRPRVTQVYRFSGEQGKRDSIIVVAQLSPEFTARLVDRWQELEAQVQQLNPANMSRLQLLEMAAETERERLALEHKVAEQAPKVEVYDRIADDSGMYHVRAAAKVLGVGPCQFVTWLLDHGWAYRHAGKGHLLAYQDKLDRGWLAHKLTPFWNHRTQMNETSAAVRVTPLGLTVLAKQADRMLAAA